MIHHFRSLTSTGMGQRVQSVKVRRRLRNYTAIKQKIPGVQIPDTEYRIAKPQVSLDSRNKLGSDKGSDGSWYCLLMLRYELLFAVTKNISGKVPLTDVISWTLVKLNLPWILILIAKYFSDKLYCPYIQYVDNGVVTCEIRYHRSVLHSCL
jgi:hypothetical protein